MPLFKRDTTPPPPPPAPVEEKRGGLFRRSHDHSTVSPASNSNRSSRTGSINNKHHNNHVAANDHTATNGSAFHSSGIGSFLRRDKGEDPSIAAARERVLSAEAAEREADKALIAARDAVRMAREHVAKLEREAEEEARLAKIKQTQARSISERARPLGRHG